MSNQGSESESPVIPSPTPKRIRPRTNKDWWPDQLQLDLLAQHATSQDSNPVRRGAVVLKRLLCDVAWPTD